MARFPAPAMRADGVKRANLKVDFLIDRETLITVLSQEAWHSETAWGNCDRDVSKADADRYIREHFYTHGASDTDFVGDDSEEAEALEWAARQVDRLYPNF